MARLIDMTGWKMWEHGIPNSRLVVIRRVENDNRGEAHWLCECSCEKHTRLVVAGNAIRSGHTLSCGCLQKERTSRAKKKYNRYDMDNYEYGVGYTSKGEEFWFDKEDFDLINIYCWRYDNHGYVITENPETGSTLSLHRLIMQCTDSSFDVNHKTHPPRNKHKKDNRKCNLNIVTRSENLMNASLKINNTSGVTGVEWRRDSCKWRARICVNGNQITLGCFNEFEDAVQARKEAEIKYFGEHRYDANN